MSLIPPYNSLRGDAQTTNSCSNQPLKVYRASGWQQNTPPSNAIDNNLNTRWSSSALGAWIQIYAGSGKVICSVDIAWYKSNLRLYNFDISIWDPSISKWVMVFSGRSSSITSGFEGYNFADVQGAYVMVRVQGNTQNNFASIKEIDVKGYVPSAPPPSPTTGYDNFEGGTYSLTDGEVSPNQKWKCRFTGFGTARVVEDATGNNYMYLAPQASTSPGETHAAAVDTTTTYRDFELNVDVRTIDQLRENSPPNNWETAWLNWNSIDQFHYYGFTLKISGNQLEKKDNDIHDDAAEIFLVTKSSPSVKLDTWQNWRIKVTGTASGSPYIEIWVDGAKIIDYVDSELWIPRNSEKMKQGGTITLYTEDAAVAFDNINITPL